MDAASPEFARAWQLYFKQRGGVGPTLPPDVMPVMVLDDNSAGPYPPYRPWFAGLINIAGGAGLRTAIGVMNQEGTPAGGGIVGTSQVRSVVVVDFIRFVSTDAGVAAPVDIALVMGEPNNTPLLLNIQVVDDAAPEKDPTSSVQPRIGMVAIGSRNSLTFTNQQRVPVRTMLPQDLKGPFILGPQQILYVEQTALLGTLSCFFQGRYYAGA